MQPIRQSTLRNWRDFRPNTGLHSTQHKPNLVKKWLRPTFSNCPKWPTQISHRKKSCEKTQFYLPKFRISQVSIPQKTTKNDTPKVTWRSSAVSSLVLSKALGADQHEALDQRQAHQLCGLGWSGSYAVHRMGPVLGSVEMLGCWISVALWKMLVDKQLLPCFVFYF